MATEKPIDRERIRQPPYDSGSVVECRWHIDRLDAPKGRVWAVKIVPDGPYLTAQTVVVRGHFDGIVGRPVRDVQPRAFLLLRGRVVQRSPRLISILNLEDSHV